MDTEEFFKKHIDGCLFCDLRSMDKCKVVKGVYGGCGYPKLMAILSGMELLGWLLGTEKISDTDSENHFLNFWNNFLVDYEKSYEGLGEFVYDLIRNSLMHSYLTKYGVLVGDEKQNKRKHLEYNKEFQVFFIDPKRLNKDFYNCYTKKVKPIIFNSKNGKNGINRELVTENLYRLLHRYEDDKIDWFKKLKDKEKVGYTFKNFPGSLPSSLDGPIIVNTNIATSDSSLGTSLIDIKKGSMKEIFQLNGKDISGL